MENNAFPIDFESLNKGDLIPQSKIESIYQVQYRSNPKDYAFCQMRLASEIRTRRTDLAAHVKSSDTSIEILSDEQAEVHSKRLFEQARQRITTTGIRRASIDRSGFDSSKRTAAESQDRVIQASMVELRRINEQARRDELLAPPATKELKEPTNQ